MAPSDLPLNYTPSSVHVVDLLFCLPTLIPASPGSWTLIFLQGITPPRSQSLRFKWSWLYLSLHRWVLELLDEALPDTDSSGLSSSMSCSLETSPKPFYIFILYILFKQWIHNVTHSVLSHLSSLPSLTSFHVSSLMGTSSSWPKARETFLDTSDFQEWQPTWLVVERTLRPPANKDYPHIWGK